MRTKEREGPLITFWSPSRIFCAIIVDSQYKKWTTSSSFPLFAFPIAAFYADDAEEGNPVVVLVDDAFARVEDPVHPAVGFLRGRRPRRLLWQAQTRFFEQLARRAVEGVFAPFQSAAGKGPLSGAVTAFSPTDEKLAVFGEQDDADADPRVHNISSSSSRAVSRLARVAFVPM